LFHRVKSLADFDRLVREQMEKSSTLVAQAGGDEADGKIQADLS
jgi:hypothetical protein